MQVAKTIAEMKQYVAEVTGHQFPQPENWFGIKDEQLAELERILDGHKTDELEAIL